MVEIQNIFTEATNHAGHGDESVTLAEEILNDVMRFRRIVNSDSACLTTVCEPCLAPHLPKISAKIQQHKPVTFVLPAFPGKSPNPAKVLGTLPDMAERRALSFLNSLCAQITNRYQPGARIILCSDGRVFNDVIGMKEDDVTAYQNEIRRIIEEQQLNNISTFSLDELCEGDDFTGTRERLMSRFGKPLESLRERVRRGGNGSTDIDEIESHRMYCGMTRFLVEDASHPGQTKSRTAIQKECRIKAYQLILRSNAWSELIAERFSDAVRLSIHPQTCGAKKLGLQLLGTDSWMTPWHGVAVDTGKEFLLMKRWEAEKLAAELVYDSEGRPSHFKLKQAAFHEN